MTCTNCQAQTAPGIYLCKRCVTRLEDVLTQIEDVLEIAEDTIAKQDRTGGAGGGGSPSESVEPINLSTMDKRRELWGQVVSFARMTLEHDDSDDLRNVEPVVYLQMSMDLIKHQDFAGDMLDELMGKHRALMKAVDRAPDILSLGQCGIVHEGVPCPGELRARKDEPFTRCRVCGNTHNAVEIQQARIGDAWEHFDTLSNVVSFMREAGYAINPKSAQRWARRGELKVLRYREDGVALYSPGQVRSAHLRMQNRKGGRPRKVA